MKRVILESPYKGRDKSEVARNELYARLCMLQCLRTGRAPMVSHLLYTQCLDDGISKERRLGIEAGLAWGTEGVETVAFMDLGVSEGMVIGTERAREQGRRWRYEQLDADLIEIYNNKAPTL